MYLITDRLVVDEDIAYEADIDRCVQLVNLHQSVAVGTFAEAALVLLGLGLTKSSVADIMAAAVAANDLEEVDVLPSEGSKYALPR